VNTDTENTESPSWLKQNGPTVQDTSELSEESKVHEPEPLRFPLTPFNEINISTNIDYAVMDILPRTGIVSVWGAYSSGKSFWTLNLVMHIALDWEFRGMPVKQGIVVYCAFEGQSGFSKRVEAFRLHHMAEDDENIPFYLMPSSIDLIGEVDQLIEDITGQNVAPDVVVLDTLARSMSGDESRTVDMCKYFAAADAIRAEFDCLVIIVHHSGYDETHPRGAIALASNSEGLIKIYRDQFDCVCSLVEKYKDGEAGHKTRSQLEQILIGTNKEKQDITSCILTEKEITALAGTGKLTKNQITLLNMVDDAIPAGLDAHDWRKKAKEAGIGKKRIADFDDTRRQLKKKKLVHDYNGRWFASMKR
jgi:hypothetical protein